MSETATYKVAGMSCEHCVRAVTDEVVGIPGVTGVDVELASGKVHVTSDAPIKREVVREAVAKAGYEADP